MKFKIIAVIFSTLFLTSILSACHTMRGVGQDIQAGGRGLSGAAAKHGGGDNKTTD